jgi:hypothetical protein
MSIFEGSWPRCQDVSIVGADIRFVLDVDRTYDLTSAYQRDPHLQLVECATTEQLLAFVHAWGPLTLSWDEVQRRTGSAPLEGYWAFQRWLKGVVTLLSAFKGRERERESLQEFIHAEMAWQRSVKQSAASDFLLKGLRLWCNIEGDVAAWLTDAPLPELRSALAFVVQTVPIGAATSLECIRSSRKPNVRARWSVSTLQEAARWMVWYDEFTRNPLVCCQSCRKIFRPNTAHVRKYCSYDCAHRVAARLWQRKQAKLKRGVEHVTHKAR